ncbi:uncharacterized protein LOC116417741 [Nasonia vitripennis]|uniref:Ubiquitin-like protease family profile domain-containing protein n=1 Tax=Nasonia vitripennis TaxID=7425 RepID=A0A7M7QJ35_NASVI|nr:uncharacterized protein LOC116417741 [Nasonia vitripennis]
MEEAAKKKIEKTKTLRMLKGRRRRRYLDSGKEDYGEGANRPDISPESYEILVQQHLEKLRKDQTNRVEIERAIVNQSECDLWYQKRRELLTASNFGKICRKRNSTSSSAIVKSILYPPVLNLLALAYGVENEASARNVVQKIKTRYTTRWLLIDEDDEYLGASVDGFIGNDGSVEIKNPLSAANLTIHQALKRKKHLRRIFSKEDINKMNTSHQYYYQVQDQLHVSRKDYCIFALCPKIDIKYIRVERNDDFWQKRMAEPLRRFYFDCLLPELLDSHYNRNMALREPDYVVEAHREQQRKAAEKAAKTKRKVTIQSKTKEKRSRTSVINIADNVANNDTKDMSSLTETAEHQCDASVPIESNGSSIEDQRSILAVLYVNINMDQVYSNILDIESLLNDDSIESFFQLVQKKESNYEIHPTIYFQFYDLLPEQFLGFHGKIHVQIIGGHPDFEHWICMRYNGKYLQIFDSINRTHMSQLHAVEKAYFNHRYPQLKWENVRFAKVTQQPDGVSCGVYSLAFMTDIILKKDVTKIKYSQNAIVMRNHAVAILKQQDLISFPYRR